MKIVYFLRKTISGWIQCECGVRDIDWLIENNQTHVVEGMTKTRLIAVTKLGAYFMDTKGTK